MELAGQGREAETGYLINLNASFAVSALLLFTWFCPFAAQSQTEAGSLAAIFAVFIGWGIIFMWSGMCEVPWAIRFVPYALIDIPNAGDAWPNPVITLVSQLSAFVLVLCVACYRFVKVRRVL